MRLLCGVVGILLVSVLATSAHAVGVPTVPVPTLPTVTLPVSTPTLPVPTPSVPTPTVPTPPVPTPTVPTPTVPTPTVPKAPAPTPTTPARSTPATAPPSTTTGGSRPSPAAAATAPSAAVASSGSAPAGTGRASRRTRALRLLRPPVVGRFRSARAQRIRVTVTELAPVCRHVGVFRLRLHKGRNVVRIPKRFAKPGSYALVGRAHGDDLFTLHARLVDRRRVRFDAIANVCRLGSATPELASTSSGAAGGGRPTIHAKSATERKQAAPFTPPTHRSHSSPIVRAVSLGDAPTPLKPLLYGLLAVSILLLGAAALPQHVLVGAGRTGAVIAQRRGYIAAAGIWLLAVVAVVTIFA